MRYMLEKHIVAILLALRHRESSARHRARDYHAEDRRHPMCKYWVREAYEARMARKELEQRGAVQR